MNLSSLVEESLFSLEDIKKELKKWLKSVDNSELTSEIEKSLNKNVEIVRLIATAFYSVGFEDF